MKSVSIRDLHLATGRWIRRVGAGSKLVITDRGRPVATVVPYVAGAMGKGLPNREAEIRRLPRLPSDSVEFISEGRERS